MRWRPNFGVSDRLNLTKAKGSSIVKRSFGAKPEKPLALRQACRRSGIENGAESEKYRAGTTPGASSQEGAGVGRTSEDVRISEEQAYLCSGELRRSWTDS